MRTFIKFKASYTLQREKVCYFVIWTPLGIYVEQIKEMMILGKNMVNQLKISI
ncbi:unnamed protein product [Tenebrio molitor]|nr:unnamed protein product [Tenebrio molitor]